MLAGAWEVLGSGLVTALAIEFAPSSLADVVSWEHDLQRLSELGFSARDLRCPNQRKGEVGNKIDSNWVLETIVESVHFFWNRARKRIASPGESSSLCLPLRPKATKQEVSAFIGDTLDHLGPSAATDFWVQFEHEAPNP